MNVIAPKAYDRYKESEVEWLGKIPSHWVVTRNKDIFEERGSLSKVGDETLLTVSHITGVTKRSEKNVNMFMAESHVGYKHCKKGDLVINTMWAWMGALGTSRDDGICSPAYGVYKPKKNVPYEHRFFDFLYRTPNAVREMTRNSKGIVSSRLRLYAKDFFRIETALPPLAEQTLIANYIVSNTSKIDIEISLLNQKSNLYKSLRESLIDEVVINGLNAIIPTKFSGDKAIGNIPEHWEVLRLKEVANIQNSNVDKKSHEDEYPVKLCNYVDVYKNEFIDNTIEFMQATADKNEISRFEIIQDDIFITKDSETCEDIAVPALAVESLENVLCGYHLAQIRCDSKKMVGAYLFRLFQSKKYGHRFIVHAKGITRVGLGQSAISDAITPIPPLKEQNEIVSYLNQKTKTIDTVIKDINKKLNRLSELRVAIISDAVTGKIKVAVES
jgi:type I restriction enzyme S subunit